MQLLAYEPLCDSSRAETITQQEKSVLIHSIISGRATQSPVYDNIV